MYSTQPMIGAKYGDHHASHSLLTELKTAVMNYDQQCCCLLLLLCADMAESAKFRMPFITFVKWSVLAAVNVILLAAAAGLPSYHDTC
jgi:hypothetical protein